MSVQVKPTYFTAIPKLLEHDEVVFDEVMRLASLVRAIDPTLPTHLRLFRRAQTDNPSAGPEAKVLLTSDLRADLRGGLQDSAPVDLLEKARQLLGDRVVGRLSEAMSSQDMGLQRAFQAASIAGKSSLTKNALNDGDTSVYSSTPQMAPELAFLNDPFLTQLAIGLTEHGEIPVNEENTANNFLHKIVGVRKALSSDVSDLSVPKVKEVIQDIQSLSSSRGHPTFEESINHGMLAYSLLSGGKGWAAPLLSQKNLQVNCFTGYGGVSPIVASIAKDDAASIKTLLEAGVSANSLMPSVPNIFNREDMSKIVRTAGEQIPLVVFAASVGSSKGISLLAKNGADLNLLSSTNETALMIAAKSGDEKSMRVLLENGANPNLKNNDGLTAFDLAQDPALKNLLKVSPKGSGPKLGF